MLSLSANSARRSTSSCIGRGGPFDEERDVAERLTALLRRISRGETEVIDAAERRRHFDDQLVHHRASRNGTITLLITSTLARI